MDFTLGQAELLEVSELDWTPVSPAPARITALGGGTGLAVLLQGLRMRFFPPGKRREGDDERLTAIVTVADDGGSTGVLRQAFRILAPGDIRNCLLALSDADPALQALFNYRFDSKVNEHSLGNLMLAALALLEADFGKAVERASKILEVRGCVLPVTIDNVELRAEFADGSSAVGESSITAARRQIRRISLVPSDTQAHPKAIKAISLSDLVVIGPGSLYTSLIPNLLVNGIARAIAESGAHVVLVMNLMTEPGETDGYSATDVLRALREHAPELPIHSVLLNNAAIPVEWQKQYGEKHAVMIAADVHSVRAMGYRAVECDLVGNGPMIRHEPTKLAKALLERVGRDLL